MSVFIALVLAGLANGSVYALVATGLVVVFKASRAANFAWGELGTAGAFIVFELVDYKGLPFLIAVLIACVCTAGIGVGIEHIAVRPADSSLQTLILTLGLATVITGINSVFFAKGGPYIAPTLFAGKTISVASVVISTQYLVIFVAGVTAMLVLYVLYERTPVGLRLKASSENANLAAISGIRVSRYVSASWAISGALAALAASLYAPTTFLQTVLMAAILFKGYAAGIVGGLDSFPGAIAGGIGLGLIESFSGKFFNGSYQEALTFLIVIIVLWIRPVGIFGRTNLVRV